MCIHQLMTKILSAIITAALIKSRKRSDGGHPIVIRIQYNGRAEKYLPHSCPLEFWDAKKSRVKSSLKGSSVINATIAKEIAKAENRKQWYESRGEKYTAKMLIADNEQSNEAESLTYRSVHNDLIRVKRYTEHTVNIYDYAYKLLQEYVHDDDFSILSLTPSFCEGMSRWLSKTRSAASVRSILSRYGVVYRHAIEMGVVDPAKNPHPFTTYKYWKTYRLNSKRIGRTEEIMNLLENDYCNRMSQVEPFEGVWWYREGVVEELLTQRSSLNFCQAMCLMCYKMQGLALCDLLRVRSDNVTKQKIGEDEYYIFTNVKRQKTKRPINVISVKRTNVNAVTMQCQPQRKL